MSQDQERAPKGATAALGVGALGALGVALASASLAFGQAGPSSKPRTLHEYFEPAPLGPSRAQRPEPSARQSAREPGQPPSLTLNTREDEPVMASQGPLSDLPLPNPQGELDPQTAANKLDDKTDMVDELNYFANFDPSVIPLKRGVAQNKIILDASSDYAFIVDAGQAQRVALDGAAKRSDEDTFWGTFLISAAPGQPVPIPSVSAQQRVLKIITEPQVELEVLRDRADNYALRASHRGLVRVNMLIAAPRAYFDGELDASVSWSSLARDKVTAMPPRAHEASRRVLASLGLSREQLTPHQALMRLVEHHRGFEGKPLPPQPPGQDVYETLSTLRVGVCRHRSFAFVMSASALGIPARYVYNEAHAFVEVHWPGLGWRRIDLGGAAEDVILRAGAERQRVHDGASQDTLPQPPSYTQELTRQAQQSSGAGAGSGAGESSQASGGAQSSAAPAPGERAEGQPPEGPLDAASGLDAASSPQPPDPRQPATLSLALGQTRVQRGQEVQVSGALLHGELQGGLGQRAVQVILSPVGARHGQAGASLLGQTTTDDQGRFTLRVRVPKELPIGRWSIHAVFPGDEAHQAAQSP